MTTIGFDRSLGGELPPSDHAMCLDEIVGDSMKILIVEDEARLADVLHQGLREHGFVVELARDGLVGLRAILSGSYDAVVLDVMLPERDGFEVLRQVRKAGNIIPILMLTARGGVDDRVRGLNLGADDYLPKPFIFKELLARLHAITRRPAVEPQDLLRVADLEMDPRRREVGRAGNPVDLSPREFALLEYLMRRKGLVLTRAMIMDHVWASDYNYDGSSNLVDVFVNTLRKKIDAGHPVKLLHTVRGAGYVLREQA